MSKINVNINRNIQDPFYRYKMPKIVAKVEGKGNGIKTVIANMTDIAKALSRPPTYPTKYFGCELGAQTNFDVKNDRYIVNGEHDSSKLQDILDGFIKKFVLCPECDNPETTLTVKRQTIHGKCKACGNSFTADPKQKLSTFILKNPPPTDSAESENKEKHDSGSPNEDGDDEVISSPVNGKARDPPAPDNDETDWAPEPIEEADLIPTQIGKLILNKDLEKGKEERLDMLHQYFKKSVEDDSIQDAKKMLNEAERLDLKNKAPLLLVAVLFDEDIINQIKKYRTLLLRFCYEDEKAQRCLLGGVEQLIWERKDALLQKSAHIIKALYDADICEEEVLLDWGKKPTKKYVEKEVAKEIVKNAQPVLKWLEEAEEDSESDEEEIAIAFDNQRSVGTADTKKVASQKVGTNKHGKEEDEIDIDKI